MKKPKVYCLNLPNETHGQNGPVLAFSPKHLYSLWDMIEFYATPLLHTHNLIQGELGLLGRIEKRRQGGKPISRNYARRVRGILEQVRLNLNGLDLPMTRVRASMFLDLMPCRTVSYQVIGTEMGGLLRTIIAEVKERNFAFIPVNKSAFFEKKALFGRAVNRAFPSARQDIMDAGNCLAADLNTAAIFHLMRIVEFGLRALAENQNVKIPRKPLDLAGWDEIINKLDEKISKRFNRKVPTGPPIPPPKPKRRSYEKKEQDREFFRGAIHAFYGFKDVWRNNVMHSRKNYDEHEAVSVLNYVRDFMQRLAKRLTE